MKIKSAGICKMAFRIALMIPALAVARDTLAAVYPYGVCAHVTRSERTPERLHGTFLSMEIAGILGLRRLHAGVSGGLDAEAGRVA